MKYLIIAFLMVMVGCGYHYETEVKQDCNGKYTVATYIRKGLTTESADAHFTWGKDFRGITISEIPAVVKDHKKWATETIAKLKEVDSLINN